MRFRVSYTEPGKGAEIKRFVFRCDAEDEVAAVLCHSARAPAGTRLVFYEVHGQTEGERLNRRHRERSVLGAWRVTDGRWRPETQ